MKSRLKHCLYCLLLIVLCCFVGCNQKESSIDTMGNGDIKLEDVSSVAILYNYNPKESTYESFTQMNLNDGVATLSFFENGENIQSDYTVDTFYDLLKLVYKTNVEEYQPSTTDTGKIQYEVVPIIIRISTSHEHYYYIPENMDEISSKFDDLKTDVLKDFQNNPADSVNTDTINTGTNKEYDYSIDGNTTQGYLDGEIN